MPSDPPGLSEGWVSLNCPDCRARMRIRRQYAHLRGRCPECGRRIEPREPPPLRPAPILSDSAEPVGLVPIEVEEWPEPARLERAEDADGLYQMASSPQAWPVTLTPAAQPIAGSLNEPDERYGLAEGFAPAPSRTEAAPEAKPYDTLPAPVSGPLPPPEPVPSYLEEAAPACPRAAHPTVRAQWQAVLLFPWQPANLLKWLFMGVNFTMLALLATTVFWFIVVGGILLAFIPPMLAAVATTAFLAGGDAADKFLAVLEGSASGAERVTWGARAGIVEALGPLLFLLWVVAAALLPPFLLCVVAFGGLPEWPLGWLGVASVWTLIFPLMLFSSLAADSRWMVVHPPTVAALVGRPFAYAGLWLLSLGLFAGCGWLTAAAIGHLQFTLAPILGFVAAACLLIYARALGRVAWLITVGGTQRVRRRRRDIDTGGPVLPSDVGPGSSTVLGPGRDGL